VAAIVPDLTVIQINGRSDVYAARRATRKFLGQAGFPRIATEEMVLVAVELATNLLRHASPGGELTLRSIDSEAGFGVEITSRDNGPGITNVALALKEGTSTVGGLGGGLSTVRDYVDELLITSEPGGTTIVARRWQRAI
jgi:serine/threonine-protein kinase RsbT